MFMYVCITCVPDDCGGQKKVLNSIELDLSTVISHHVGAWNSAWVFCKTRQCPQPLSCLSFPEKKLLKTLHKCGIMFKLCFLAGKHDIVNMLVPHNLTSKFKSNYCQNPSKAFYRHRQPQFKMYIVKHRSQNDREYSESELYPL